MKPKVFVGTLHSGEGDFLRCIQTIHEQLDVSITHVIISNLPEKQAHNALWSAWNNVKNEHDFFVKVDADTVLKSRDILKKIWKLMSANKDVTGIQCPLHDFYSDSLINGLNCFTPDVTFNVTTDDLYCDRVDTNHKTVLRQPALPGALIPAGYHCHYSTEKHAFHYGLHRTLKKQTALMKKVKKAWETNGYDNIRGMAVMGSQAASQFKNGGFNYGDQEFQDAFATAMLNYQSFLKSEKT